MHEYTPEAAQAIESRSRQFTHRLMVDWSNNGKYDHPLSDMSQYVVRTSRDQAISSTAPDELMLIEGHGAASLEIEVAGSYKSIPLVGHFMPYNGRSAFYSTGLDIALGADMYYEIAIWTDSGWEWYRQFTGVIREIDSDRSPGIVQLYCLDNVEKLRTQMSLPAFSVHLSHLQDGYKRGGLADSSSLIDMAARTAGFTNGPHIGPVNIDPYRQTVLSAPMHGSYIPEVGMLDNAQEIHLTESWENNQFAYRAEAYTAGPHGYLALNAVPPARQDWGVKNYWVDSSTTAGFGLQGSKTLSCWVKWEGPDKSNTSEVITLRNRSHSLQLLLRNDGAVTARLMRDNTTPTNGHWQWLDDPGWYYIEAGFEVGPNYVKSRTRVNDDYSPIMTLPGGGLTLRNDALDGLTQVQHRFAISDVEVIASGYGNDLQWMNKSIELQDSARVSWGRNRLTHTYKRSDLLAWDLAKELASAEYGVVLFDEYGRFVFWNFEDVTAQQETVQRVFDISHVKGLNVRTTMDSVRNKWVVTTTTANADWNIAWDFGRDGVPFDRKRNSDGSWEYFPAKFNGDAAQSVGGVIKVASNHFYFPAKENMICVDPWAVPTIGANSHWEDRAPFHAKKNYTGSNYNGASVRTEQKWMSRDMVRLAIGNNSTSIIGWVGPNNIRRFRVRGMMIHENQPVTWTTQDTTSIDKYGERVLELSDNFWLQDRFQTSLMLKKVIDKFGRPIPVTDNITVPGDPRIQIGDVVEVRDEQGMGERIRLQIYGITRTLEDGTGLTDTYKVEVIQPPGQGIWDSTTYGRWDTSLIWGD